MRTAEPLFWLAGCGHETYGSPGYYYNASRRPDRPHATLQLTLAGTGFYQTTAGRHLLTPGRAFFAVIPGAFEYGYEPGSTRAHELVFVSLQGEQAMQWYERITARFGPVLDLGRGSAVAEQMLSIAHAQEAGTLPNRYETSALLYQLLMTAYSTLSSARSLTSPRVSRAIELILDHATDADFNVETLAKRLGCTREYLARLFRKATGIAPSDYLLQQRVRLVSRALRETDEKLDLIARRCGFSGANYLCRAFKKQAGVTPDRFRQDRWRAIG